ncbi:family 78 glycoside hydrolase catalytic domain [Draconibacterium sp. IB214405]|uniref:family 78 glycoside hydrolase catalytic domain n=1 Tax=Draconibacterium sp. IB214405 TaxID=3097352 RepID=UPI002A11C7AC|nr:family 78 glycoside hydrolase catalytic domain [Draconibacterium sp. IB214405]MDX8337748.1 family 78 glycoside hydrolase catalytic domain [Draconibacterium sp. IB214405]
MNKTRIFTKHLTAYLLVVVLAAMFGCSKEKVAIDKLTVEYTPTPLGIDVELPRFGWQMNAPENQRGVYQTAYQLQVKSADGELVWDSGKVDNVKALAITYEGKPLKAETRYNWTVNVWDQNDEMHTASSWFETGMMNPDIAAWDGGDWIGGSDDDLVFFSDYQLLFGLKYNVAIEEGSTKAGFVYGANDLRLMDKYKNIYQLENKLNESYIKLELDISDLENSANGSAKLNIYRAGYTPNDNANEPFKTFKIKSSVINSATKYAPHNIAFISEYGKISISIDGVDEFFVSDKPDRPMGGMPPFMQQNRGATVILNPIGSNHDYIPFGMICDMGFSMEAGQKATFSDLKIFNHRTPNNTLFQEDLSGNYEGIFAGKLKVKNDAYVVEGGEDGSFIVADPSRNSTPMLRTEFNLKKGIESARLYVTARGIYEVQINGEKVGNDYYNPGQTQYNKSHFYQTYDVTDQLNEGANAMGAMLSEGWWSGLLSFGSYWNYFGDRQSLLAKLVITYDDGSTDMITSNDKDWQYYNDGPIQYSSLDLGEIYDATKDEKVTGWSKPGFDNSAWKTASIVPLEGTTYSGEERDFTGAVTHFNYDEMKLIGQIGNNAGQFATLTAKSMEEVRPGVYVYDMGQNFVGVPKIAIANGASGDTLILRYAEILYPDLDESGDNVGMIMTENYRAAISQDMYIMKDGTQVFQPKFTSHGYQYIEITGIDEALPIEAVQGVSISSVVDLTADYQTSNAKVNQLWSNLTWSNVDNFLTLPTDCPQRNERMGWSGDISVFSRTATYVSNTAQFLRRHMIAMRDVQKASGKFTDIAPIGGGFGGLLWGSAGITVPWEVYQQYNDEALLAEHYDAMVAYIDYLETTIDPKTGITTDGQLGDWLGPQNNKLGTPYLTTAYHIFDLWIMKNVADILGKEADAARFEKLYSDRKAFFNKTFVNDEGKTMGLIGGGMAFGPRPAPAPELKLADTQTSYAVGLALGAFNDDITPDMAKNLATAIERKNTDDDGIERPEYSLMTGFIGTAWVSKALSDYGYNEQAYKLLQNNQYPSWLYSIDQGATTIWERLNGYTVENGFGGNNSMNSFNHYSFGAVGQWMIAYSLGIQRDEPGFQKFILQPTPDPTGEMKWAEGYYDSMYGKIYSKWEIDGGQLTYTATVPANTSATLFLPAKSENDVIDANGCELVKFENGKAVYSLKSGNYRFVTNL